ncbi:hypothetical protein [Anabaena sp. UHCC 0451]|uniref:hypothetical protein n=1 Tax=Anabaena sp. UHCC 0451 TaxID=2055235 RepID=UPI002B20780C|nr:hypothetical protein [Anabaena sp. UHCC 0451]MEA5579706.1 hypothetical protein [Anabaena sp. UHCC 0451]
MTHTERKQIKQLLKDTFWQFSTEDPQNITPKLIRYWASKNLHPEIIEATAINYIGSDFWYRVEKLCYLMKHLHYWLTLE